MDIDTELPTGSILVVDCDDRELRSTVSMLRSEGYSATGAPGFEVARRLLKEHRFDLLMTPVRLLPYNGLHLVIHNQTLHPGAKAVVFADRSDVGIDGEIERLGAHSVQTPIEPSRLLALIRLVLEDRPVRSKLKPA